MAALSVLFGGPIEPASARALLVERGAASEREGALLLPGDFRLLVEAAPPLPEPALADAARDADDEGALVDRCRRARRIVLRADEPDADRALARLEALTRAARPLLSLPGALALHADAAGALTAAAAAARRIDEARAGAPPLELWVALRRFRLDDARGWFLDTLGMGQLGFPDVEAYAADGPAATVVGRWLRNVALHLAQLGASVPPLADGDTLDGPDEDPWVTRADTATAPPARPVLRFAPLQP